MTTLGDLCLLAMVERGGFTVEEAEEHRATFVIHGLVRDGLAQWEPLTSMWGHTVPGRWVPTPDGIAQAAAALQRVRP